jgi:neutral ceramidase
MRHQRMIRVGFASERITPEPGLLLAGGGEPDPAETTEFPLEVRVMMLDDGETQACIVALDLLFLNAVTVEQYRRRASEASGVPAGNIAIACSHTHYAPYTTAVHDGEPDFEYLDSVSERLAAAAALAAESLAPSELLFASADVPGWTFNRRPTYSSGQVGTEGPAYGPEFVRLEGPADDEVQLLLARSTEGVVLGGVVNFACHATVRDDGAPKYSADYPGRLREVLSEALGGTFLYTAGASGNLWAFDLSLASPRYSDSMKHLREMALALGEALVDELRENAKPIGNRIAVLRDILEIDQRRPTREQVRLARWYLEKAPDEIDQREFTRRIYGHDYTFYENRAWEQEWFARETIGMWEWQRRVGTRSLSEKVEVQAICIGDFAFVTFPVELFCEFGLEVKNRSPLPHTMVSTLTNGWHGYVPTAEGFRRGGYEPRLGQQSRLDQGAGPRMTLAALRLVNEAWAPAKRT